MHDQRRRAECEKEESIFDELFQIYTEIEIEIFLLLKSLYLLWYLSLVRGEYFMKRRAQASRELKNTKLYDTHSLRSCSES